VPEPLLDRVSQLSPTQLALLSLRLRHRSAASHDVLAAPAMQPISSEPEPRVDELSDEEVDALLKRVLREQLPGGNADARPSTVIRASERSLPAFGENLDQLSDEEVEALLDELLRKEEKTG